MSGIIDMIGDVYIFKGSLEIYYKPSCISQSTATLINKPLINKF